MKIPVYKPMPGISGHTLNSKLAFEDYCKYRFLHSRAVTKQIIMMVERGIRLSV